MTLTFAVLGAAGCAPEQGADTIDEQLRIAAPTLSCPAPVRSRFRVNIDPRRSLMVTDRDVLESVDANGNQRFSLRRVLDQLASQNGNSAIDGLKMFRQLWDTQNPAPGVEAGAHCDDNGGTINGFPNSCRAEGIQATQTPATFLDGYIPIALVNRFDLAPTNGSHCGEYRVIYAKGTGSGRNFIIFEAVLPNPTPSCGLNACRPIQQMWSSLTNISSAEQRAALLDTHFFTGTSGFAPVIHFSHFASSGGSYSNGSSGQIRTNQFMQGPWTLKEFKLARSCRTVTRTPSRAGRTSRGLISARAACQLRFQPISVKQAPFGPLFDPSNAAGASFQQDFVTQVANLSASNLNRIGYAVDGAYFAAETPSGSDSNYRSQFAAAGAGSTFEANIQSALNQLGSSLSPQDIVARAETQNCMGCHQNMNNRNIGGGLVWPASLGFVHVSEFDEAGPDGRRFRISPALTSTFLPERERIVERYLSGHLQAAVARSGSTTESNLLGRPAAH